MRRHRTSALAGAAAVLCRQTNVVWVAFVAGVRTETPLHTCPLMTHKALDALQTGHGFLLSVLDVTLPLCRLVSSAHKRFTPHDRILNQTALAMSIKTARAWTARSPYQLSVVLAQRAHSRLND